MTYHEKNLAVGLLALAVGLAYALCIPYEVSDYSEGHNVSGRTLPAILAVLLMLAGAGLSVRSWLARKRNLPAAGAETPPMSPAARRRVAAYACLVAGYTLGLTYVGFIVSTAAAMWLSMRLSGAGRPVLTAGISIAGAVFLYVFFTLVMDVYFPSGWLL